MAKNLEAKRSKRPKTDDTVPKYCEYKCGKKFDNVGCNRENYNRHLKACLYRPERLEKQRKMFNYFKRSVSPPVSDENGDSSTSRSNVDITDITDVVNLGEGVSTVDTTPVEIQDDQGSIILNDVRQRCQGKEFWVDSLDSPSFYRNYPFHRHFISSGNDYYKLSYRINIIYDPNNGVNKMIVHSLYCKDELIDDDGISKKCNKMCSEVTNTKAFKNMLKLSADISNNPTIPIEMLTYDQLQCNYRELKGKLNKEKLENLNLVRRNITANKRATVNDRFMNLIACNDIPRLHILLQVCLKKGMGMRSIIGRLDDAINLKYKPKKYGEEDWDKALLVLRIGGPKLLHLLHVADGYPSLRAVQSRSTSSTKLMCAVDSSFESRLEINTAGFQQSKLNISSLKMDEIATEERLRWESQTNKIIGLCFEHACSHSMELNHIGDVERIKDLLLSGTLHKTKENLVVATGDVGDGGHINPVLTLPTCTKSVTPKFDEMFEAVLKKVLVDVVASDGAADRRQYFNGRMKVIKDNEMKRLLKQLGLFDLNFIDGDKAFYLDDKHNLKRMRTMVISDKRGSKINGTVLAKDQLKYVMEKANIKKISTMLDPNDKQNVPLVLNLYDALKECREFFKNTSDPVCKELRDSMKIFYHILDGIVSVFSDPTIDLEDQLIKLSKLSHILLAEYRKSGTKFVPGQLYHDVQRMVQACFFACLLQKKRGGGKMFLYQLGTDQLEKLFSLIRTITHARNCDSLEIIQRLSHAGCIELILQKHPTWKRIHSRRLVGSRDATSQREWTGKLDLEAVNIASTWKLGEIEAIKILNLPNDYFENLKGSGVTMLRPNKRLVGVNVDTERTEEYLITSDGVASDDVDDVEDVDVAENLASLEIEEILQEDTESAIKISSTISVDGKEVHKASVVKLLLNEVEDPSSSDRLRRVRGFTKYPDKITEIQNDLDLDDCILIGDTLAAKVQVDGTASLCILRIRAIRDKTSKKYETVISGVEVGNKLFTGQIMEGKITDDNLVVNVPKSIYEEISIDGNTAVYVKMIHSKLHISEAQKVFHILPVKLGHGSSRLLPYHSSLSESSAIESAEEESISCKICEKVVNRKKMRLHVGAHILKDNLKDACGFCGEKVNIGKCNLEIAKGSGRGKTTSEVPKSGCEYFEKFSITSAAKGSKTSPCTNRPVECQVCKRVFWSYNMYDHVETCHSDYPKAEWVTKNEEKVALSKVLRK